MMEITADNLLAFEKLLIGLGGMYEVNEDMTIKNNITGKNVAIQNGKSNQTVVLFKQGIPCGDYAILNPFKETLGTNRQREWFYDNLILMVASTMKTAMIKVVKDVVDKKDDNNQQFPLMSRIMDQVDASTVDELTKISSCDYLSIFYNKKNKTAEAQANIFTEEYQKAHTKIRKKTWAVLKIFYESFFKSTSLEDEFTYQAKSVTIPEADAKLNVIYGLISSLDQWIKDILNIDFHVFEIGQHMEVLDGYAKLYAWVSTTDTSTQFNTPTNQTPPWAQAQAWQNQNQLPQTMMPASQVPGPYGMIPGGQPSGVLVPSSQVGIPSFVFGPQQQASCAGGALGVPSPVGCNTIKPIMF